MPPAPPQPNTAADDLLRVHTLGAFRVHRGDAPIPDADWAESRVKRLFKYLLVAPRHRATKDQVIELLWPDEGQDTGQNNLRRIVYRLRRALEPARGREDGSRYLLTDRDTIALAGVGWIDAEAFERQA